MFLRQRFGSQPKPNIIGFCAGALLASVVPLGVHAQTDGWTKYIVDGLALGDPVAPKSAAYKEYTCQPSEQFETFIWCQRQRAENGKFGSYQSFTSILHSTDNAAAYVSRYIVPAYFSDGDIDREIERLSQRFGARPHLLQSPRKAGLAWGVIAYWGSVTLTPLDPASLAEFAAGRHVARGMLFDYLGNFTESARSGFPIFQLGGGRGYIWGAHLDENGKGALRMTAIDASQFTALPAVARDGDNPPITGRSAGRSDTPAPGPAPNVSFSSGSGFFVSDKGYVLTNNHVVERCASIRVFMNQANWADAQEIASDTTNDLALLSTGLTPPRVAAPRMRVRLGQYVAAFGYPHVDVLATSGNFTQGNVTALAGVGDDSRYLQISAPVQAGNSGGPLLDQSGNLTGIVTAKLNALKMAEASGDLPQNINFALKASIIASFLDINGIGYMPGSATSALTPEELADQAKSMSVFILCR
jgi:S1-C subfamily serine protease